MRSRSPKGGHAPFLDARESCYASSSGPEVGDEAWVELLKEIAPGVNRVAMLYELVITPKIAKALGLEVPFRLQQIADEMI
jgi:hypothetical protein